MSIITLTTDYGLKDHFVGAIKGKILSQNPETAIVDISHHIDPFNAAEASYIVSSAYASFPKGTVHFIGVDAELNRENRHIAMQWNGHFFVCADNGIPGLIAQKTLPEKIVAVNIHDRLTEPANDIDVLVKVACHIARGGLLNVIGKEIEDIKRPTELQPVISTDRSSLKGYVIYIDHLGNAVTNISRKMFNEAAAGRDFEIVMGGSLRGNRNNLRRILSRYSDIGMETDYPIKNYEGVKIAIFNEAGFLEIGIFRANPETVGTAANLLGISYRDTVTVYFE